MGTLSPTEERRRDADKAHFDKLQRQAAAIGQYDAEHGGADRQERKGYDGKLRPSHYLKLQSLHKEMRQMILAQDKINRAKGIIK